MAKLKVTPGRLDIEIVRGAAFDKTITLTQGGEPLDISIYTKAKLQIRETADSDTVIDEYATTTTPPNPTPDVSRPGSIVLGTASIRLIAPVDVLANYKDANVWDIVLYKADDSGAWKPLGGSYGFVDGVTR